MCWILHFTTQFALEIRGLDILTGVTTPSFIVASVIKARYYSDPFYESKQSFRKSSKNSLTVNVCVYPSWLFMEPVFVCVKISWLCIWILGAFVQQCAMVWKDFFVLFLCRNISSHRKASSDKGNSRQHRLPNKGRHQVRIQENKFKCKYSSSCPTNWICTPCQKDPHENSRPSSWGPTMGWISEDWPQAKGRVSWFIGLSESRTSKVFRTVWP